MTRNETGQPRRPARRDGEADAPVVRGTDLPVTEVDGKPSRQRIAKAMARAGLCSRRDAEAWILAGRVQVNGEVLASPARDVGPDDRILVDGAPLPAAEKTRLFLFHKPRGLVTSDHDPEGRETVADFLRENWPEGPRTVTVGRLDINTEGLLLLTNDGGLARVLELPDTGWLRRYRVRAKGVTDQATLDELAAGIEIDGIAYAGIEAKLDRIQGSNCWLTMGLREGKNREIKRVLEHIGLEVNRLIRLSFGPFQLLDLPDGAVEEVRTRILRDQLGENLAAAAGVDFGAAEASQPQIMNAGSSAEARPAGDRPRLRPLAKGFHATMRQDHRPEPLLERPQRAEGTPRRHVSVLREPAATGRPDGPRRRIERSKTKDRNERTITVERVMTATEAPRAPGRKRHSPAAEGKRARVARSGGAPRSNELDGARDHHRQPSNRPDRRDTGKRNERSRVEAGVERREGGSRVSTRLMRTGDQAPPRDGRRDARSGRAAEGDGRDASRSGHRFPGRPGANRPDRKQSDDRYGAGASSRASTRNDETERTQRTAVRGEDRPSGSRPGRPGKPSSGKSSFGKSSFGKSSFGKSSFGKSSSGKTSSDRRSSGRDSSDKAPSGKPPRGGPRGPFKPKR